MVKITIKTSDPPYSKGIEVDYTNCKTEDSLKKLIADAFFIESSQITIENIPKNKILDSKVTEYNIAIINNSKSIKFKLPNLTTLTIKDGYKMKYKDIIKEFESRKTYVSLSAEDNLRINFSSKYCKGSELKKIGYPFLGVPKNATVNVVTTDSFVILEFNEIKFYLLDTDTIRIAHDLIFEAFRKEISYDSIEITKEGTKDPLPGSYKLKKKEKYYIHVKVTFEFKNLSNSKYDLIYALDYFTTVSDAQQYLFSKHQKKGFQLEDFHIMTNQNDNEIADETQYLKAYEDKHKNVYYEIAGLPKPKPTEEEPEKVQEKSKKPKKIKSYRPSVSKPTKESDSESNDDDDEDEDDDVNKSTEIKLVFEESTKYKPIKMEVNIEEELNDIKRVVSRKYKVKEDEIEIFYNLDEKDQKIEEDRVLQNIISAIIYPIKNITYDNTFSIKINHKKSQKTVSSSRPTESKKKPKIQKAPSKDDVDQKNKKKTSKNKKTSSEDDVAVEEEEVEDGSETHTVFYKTNQSDILNQSKLKIGTTVKQFKLILAKENKVKNPANIKVIFAGKDLLEDIVLDELNIGKIPLFIYIRTEKEIFLMTAKALKIGEEEEDDDDDD